MTKEGSPNSAEQNVIDNEFSHCDSYNATKSDIILVYPDDGTLTKDIGEICQRLQNVYDLLCVITPASHHQNEVHHSKIIVGFRHANDDDDGSECEAGWHKPQNRVNVPYSYLSDEGMHDIQVNLEDNLEFCCSHELVHPFEDAFLNGNQNKHWNDGFCECLRVLVLQSMSLDGYASVWENLIKKAVVNKKHDRYHDAGGRIFNWLESQDSSFRNDPAVLSGLISNLISNSMNLTLGSSGDIF